MNTLRNTPFLRILPPVVLGILAAGMGVAPWMAWTALAVCYLCAWLTLRRAAAGWAYTFGALVFTAMALTGVHATRPEIPEGRRVLLHLEITDNPAPKGRWNMTTARVGYYRDSVWHAVDQKILLGVDTCYPVAMGEQLICTAYVNPVARDSVESGYTRLMHTRGYWGRAYLTPGNLVVRSPGPPSGLRTRAKEMQRAASVRLARLGLPPEQLGIAAAMAAGERRALPAHLREAYARTGTSHILAVSGLHVGIVFGLVNLLLYLLPIFRRGHIARNVVAVAAIWAYTAMTGLSPSAVRAALMFTGAQAALASTLHHGALNVMLATATLMLLIAPGNLYDVSFQLSMAAVLAILVMYRPLYERLKSGRRAIDAFASVFIVGVAATVGTAPLVAYHFGNFPLIGIFINPVVILTSHLALLLSLCWVIAPIGAFGGAAGGLLGLCLETQNRIVEWSASLPAAALSVKLSAAQTLAVYALYLIVIIALSLRTPRPRLNFSEE